MYGTSFFRRGTMCASVSTLARLSTLARVSTRVGFAFALIVTATVLAGCTPRAGNARLTHPMLTEHSGRTSLTPGARDAFSRSGPLPSDGDESREARAEIAKAAATFVGQPQVVVGDLAFRSDCSGTVRGIYAAAGFPLGGKSAFRNENDVSIIHRFVREIGSLRRTDPRPGDLVFFDNTYDRNGDGKVNDKLSHIGVVEEVKDEGTVVFVHRVSGGILRYRLNLQQPAKRRDEYSGARLNHVLRARTGADPARTTGELFVGYGTFIVDEPPPRVALR